MPTRIVVAHADIPFIEDAARALRAANHRVATFANPVAALAALEDARHLDVLITSVDFGPRKLNGVALARMAKLRHPEVRVLFVASPEVAEHTAGLGAFLSTPTSFAGLMTAAERTLETCP